MGTLYDVLGVQKNASPLEIKKGYFAMVRKYPPERYADKFMEIRSAYETLSNEKTRREYDSMLGMSNFVRINFNHAEKYMEYGDYPKAIGILEELNSRFPGIIPVLSLLGQAYANNGNTVKAIGIYELLMGEVPDNAGFAGHLANLYLKRGWQRKAITAYLKAIELDEDNISLWIGLSEAYLANRDRENARKTLERSLQHENDENPGSFGSIYFRLALTDISSGDIKSLRRHLGSMTEIVSQYEEERENAGWALMNVTRELMHFGMYDEAKEAIKNAEKLMPENADMKNLKKTLKTFVEVNEEFSRFQDDSYDHAFKAVVFDRVFPDESFDPDPKVSRIMRIMDEYSFLNDINSLRKQINRFKDHYPALYNRIKDFLVQAITPGLNRKMLQECEKEMHKNRKIVSSILNETALDSDDIDDDIDDDFFFEPQEPVRRESPKIGRNDPCPCGSGKKYKKCCGK